jgi:hypothetical protein
MDLIQMEANPATRPSGFKEAWLAIPDNALSILCHS